MSTPNSGAYFGIRNDLADRLLAGSHQLAGVPEPDRSTVLDAALDAVPEAVRLLRPHAPSLADGDHAASRLAFSCLSAAASFPRAPRSQIAELGVLAAILFGVDDIADNVAAPASPHDVAALFGRLSALLSREGDASGEEETVRAWNAWCARFRGYEGAAAYAPILAEQLALTGDAMAREREWAGGGEPWPAYERYLDNAVPSFLYHVWWAAALAIRGPASAGAAHWRTLLPATDLGAACLRLANDIRTFERERTEGKPNAVLVLERAGMTTGEAVESVSAHIAELNTALAAAFEALPAELEPVADGQRRCVAFGGGWYMARDTHDYTVRDLAEDARRAR
ncbi:terpene synthase family protein [Nonomuraea sp. SYSU D8015]|uniref:terpene synthase family protein n=1 Tax=Nonomuraea sp. SYSU D8015 TaxID=2593644 RepID=UPI0016617AB4|nr:terpene synthase family protein [Nonomuraea sp. SYSU D8015]